MISMDKSDWIVISGFLLVMTIIALWCLDVSVSAIASNGYLTNGFLISNPYKFYHIGLYLLVLIGFSNFLIIVHVLSKHPVGKEKMEKDSQKTFPYEYKEKKGILASKKQ